MGGGEGGGGNFFGGLEEVIDQAPTQKKELNFLPKRWSFTLNLQTFLLEDLKN